MAEAHREQSHGSSSPFSVPDFARWTPNRLNRHFDLSSDGSIVGISWKQVVEYRFPQSDRLPAAAVRLQPWASLAIH